MLSTCCYVLLKKKKKKKETRIVNETFFISFFFVTNITSKSALAAKVNFRTSVLPQVQLTNINEVNSLNFSNTFMYFYKPVVMH